MNIINYIEHLNAISIQSISNIIYMYQSLDSSIYFFKRSVNENNETLSGFFFYLEHLPWSCYKVTVIIH